MLEPQDRPFDLGLQAERTALSWQRTTLSLFVGLLVAARLLTTVSVFLSSAVAGLGLIVAFMLFLFGFRRYRSTHRALVTHGNRSPFASAVPLFAWAIVVFCVAVASLGFAIVVAVAGTIR